MFFRCLTAFIWLISFSVFSFAQDEVSKVPDSEMWPHYYLQLPINNKWSVSADYSHRYSGFFESKTQWIGRTGFDYKLTEKFSLSAGYAYSEYFLANGVRREDRPWQQTQVNHSFQKLKISHRLRLEERFQRDRNSDRFNFRLRYQFMVNYPILSQQRLSCYISDEPMINFGKQIVGNMFDQNRLQGGLQIKLAENVFFMPAYMYMYQYQSSTKDFKSKNIIRTGLMYKK